MKTPTNRRLWLLTLILLAALALRLFHIQMQSLWFDEGWSAFAADQPTLAAAANADATNPPLYYVALNVFAHGLGDSTFALRLFSTFAGLLVIVVTYALARRTFGARAGVFAAVGASVLPLLWWAAQEARMYTLLALLIVTAALALDQLLRRPKHWAWLALWATELTLLYTHNTGPVVVVWVNLIVLAAWMHRRSLRFPDWSVWIGGQVGVTLLWLPYFITRYLALGTANSAVSSGPRLGLPLLAQIWGAFWAGNWAMVGVEPLLTALSVAAFVVAVLLIAWRRPAARLLIAHVLLLTAGVVAGLVVLGNELHGRYLVMIAPLLVVPIAAGISRLRLPLRILLSAFFLVLCAVAIVDAQNPIYGHDDARGMARYYARHLTAADTVLAWSYADRYELAYYWPREGVMARRVTLPEGADLAQIAPLLPRSGDVGLNIWYTQRADYRGMLGCVLAQGTLNVPEQFTTYGMSTLIFRQPTLALPQMQPFEAAYTVARIDAVAALRPSAADRAACVPVQATLTAPVPGDLKAALIARNPLGWEVARADAVFAQADERTSGQLAPGDSLTAYPLLRLPVGAPPGDYPLYLRLYEQNAAPNGFEIVSASTSISARDVQVGTWHVAPGADWSKVNRTTDLSHSINQPVAGLTLVALTQDQTLAQAVHDGDSSRISLLWRGPGPLPDLILRGPTDDTLATFPAPSGPRDDLTLDWREVRIPRGAAGALSLDAAGVTVARYEVTTIPETLAPPAFDQPVGVILPNVGTLVGYSVVGKSADLTQPLPVTLVWQAADRLDDTRYTVFVQLLDAQGQLIAQSDAPPADGARPTSGWRSGEYIVDSHALTFNDRAHPGPASLIAGMYDPATGQRVRLADGSDAIRLPGTVTVK